MEQLSFSEVEYRNKKLVTKREKFLNGMDQVVPWERLVKVIEPYYPKMSRKGGRPAIGVLKMLKIYCLQQWYNLSDPAAEEALYDIPCMRYFVGVQIDEVPDESTLLRFRHLLEEYELAKNLFEQINEYLSDNEARVSLGTIVDASIISAPSSTKNKSKKRDPQMRSTRKNNQYYFGAKVHIGVDMNSGLVHSVDYSAANQADIDSLPNLLRESDRVIIGDKGYDSDSYKRGSRHLELSWKVTMKRKPKKSLSHTQKKRNKRYSKIRSKVEHVFRVVKCQFGYRKARFKGLQKNSLQMYSLLGLANLYLIRNKLLA